MDDIEDSEQQVDTRNAAVGEFVVGAGGSPSAGFFNSRLMARRVGVQCCSGSRCGSGLGRLVFAQQAQHAAVDLLPEALFDFGQDLVLEALQRNLREVGAQAIEKLGTALEAANIALLEQAVEQVSGQRRCLLDLAVESCLCRTR